jgi:dynamin 1-like protein
VENITKEISGGARINHIFEIVYRRAIKKIDPFDTLSDDDIRTAIKNAGALKPNLFVPEGAFEILIK